VRTVLLFFALAFLAIPGIVISASTQSLSDYLDEDFRRWPASENYTGPPVAVVIGSDPQAQQFRTRLTEGARHGPNFAGIYTVVEWGCGTNCQQVAVVDARTGRVCDWLTTELGSRYQLDSRLFIENPETEECSALEWCRTNYYRFEKGKFERLE
jgi:hypothetical protein